MGSEEKLLTVTDTAHRLNRSGETVRNYERRGILRALRTTSGMRLFREKDVAALAAKLHDEQR